jgi:hypothetical protein
VVVVANEEHYPIDDASCGILAALPTQGCQFIAPLARLLFFGSERIDLSGETNSLLSIHYCVSFQTSIRQRRKFFTGRRLEKLLIAN